LPPDPSTPRIPRYASIAGVAHFVLSALAIAAAGMGPPALKKVVVFVYFSWLAAIAAVQYTHPWTGTPPETFMEMPMPLVIAATTIVGTGLMLDA